MMKVSEYKIGITASKGGRQLINVFSSTAAASFFVILINNLLGEEMKAETIQQGIDHIAGSVVFLTPIMSAIIRMVSNFIKNRKRRL